MSSYTSRLSDAASAKDTKVKEDVHVSDIMRVESFNREKMTVDLQPLSDAMIDAEYSTQRPLVAVPVAMLQFGRFNIIPWYEPGEIGVVVYCDTDTDNAMADGSDGEPNTPRNHAPEDAKFFGGIKIDSKPLPPGIPYEALVICTEAGDVFWSIQDDKMQSLGKIEHEGDIDIVGNVDIVGDVTIQGNVTVTGGDVVADGVSLKFHTHPGDSGGTTGQPNQ